MTKKTVKRFLIIALSVLIAVIIAFGSLYGIFHIGVPLEDSVVLGTEYIDIPSNLDEEYENLSVMTFNIKCCTIEDKKERYWTNRKDDVLRLITDYSSDLIGFQEVTHPQYKFLIENLGDEYGYMGTYRSGLNLERGDKLIKSSDPRTNVFNVLASSIIDEATPIFYKKSRFELIEHQTFWLNENPEKAKKGWDARHKRVCSYAKLKDHYTNNNINFLNTHFDNKGSQAKIESTSLINDYIKDMDGVILVGDFNAIEEAKPYNELTSESLVNTKYMLPEEERSSGPTGNGYGKFNKDVPIDHIFVQPTDYNTLSNIIIDERTEEGHFISDHFPVLATLKYK